MPDWQEILSREGPAAWRAAYRITGNRADADECLQEAFLGALEYARRARVRHWGALLRRLATARAVDRVRERRRRPGGPVPDWDSLQAPDAPGSRDLEDAELADRLRSALARISPRQAEVFCLHCLEDFSYEEIAQQLAVSVAAVGVHLHRARERLRELLSGSLDAPREPRAGTEDLSRSPSR
jgi:RNA polymerase sigma-70 factor (ECF subfamily)